MRSHDDPVRSGLRRNVFHHPRAAALALAAAALALNTARAQSPVVSPSDQATYEGSSSSSYPLGRANARVQQLHADLGTAARTITGHAYRRDAISTRGQLAAYQVEMTVTMSMSPKTPAQASTTFAENVGSQVVVLPRAWLSFPATDRPAVAPAPTFELRIPYATPFAYPTGGGTVCVDIALHGNVTPTGSTNTNFTALLDAHEQFTSGRVEQPGFRSGQGCAAPGATTPAHADFTLRRTASAMDFDIAARNGMPTTTTGNAYSHLLLGMRAVSRPFWLQPACQLLTSTEHAWMLAGANTSTGSWDGTLTGFAVLPTGMEFYVQVASVHALDGVALGDVSHLAVPPLGPTPITVARIAHATERTSPTGSLSQVVSVTEFF